MIVLIAKKSIEHTQKESYVRCVQLTTYDLASYQ
jgi:hypothetical protein